MLVLTRKAAADLYHWACSLGNAEPLSGGAGVVLGAFVD
ncbi:hypothetical protein LEMLEM_LOCUS11475, partial [Lemmus lemmus]